MHLPVLRLSLWACLPLASLCLLGCGGGGSSPGTAPVDTDGGTTDAGGDACDPTVQACGGCQSDKDCPAGSICDPGSAKCAPGCNASHGCQTGRACCSGSCVDPLTDAKNCGACAKNCSGGAHAAGACASGKCTVECEKGFDDCNGNAADGCETSSSSDVKNCGACGSACSTANMGVLACEAGVCTGTCASGFADCDGNKQTNGCEAQLQNDPAHCGACEHACSSQHLTGATCVQGECTGICAAGWGDCNGDKQKDGCETSFDSDPQNCGACSIVCSSSHATAACTSGVCGGTCDSGWADCNGNMLTDGCEVAITTDAAHCGGCGNKCSANHMAAVTCSAGACNGTCMSGFYDCNADKLSDGCEASLQTDPYNCGTCGNTCSANHVALACVAGACGGACETGWTDCDGNKQANGCETHTAFDASNCGACGTVCSSNHVTPSCSSGQCNGVCASGFADCNGNKQTDGCEIGVANDVTNCGFCGMACSTNHVAALCAGGACSGTCDSGWVDCDGNKQANGCEVFPATDAVNCGGCGVVCSSNHVNALCSSGVCSGACTVGYADCNANVQTDGCETSVYTDTGNCGLCGTVCSSNHIFATCNSGVCKGSCAAGYADCNSNKQTDGCETNIYTSVSTCGGCSVTCSSNNITPSCVNGVCNGACNAGWADCNSNKLSDGCEVNIQNSATSCGACGSACSANHVTPQCAAGVCNGACDSGWTDCNNNKKNDGCETNLGTDANNCGGCGVVCSSSHMQTRTCAAGICSGTCATGYTDCNSNKQLDGCEINTATDENNCGTCGNVCGSGLQCVSGVCKACNTSVLILSDTNGTTNAALTTALTNNGLTPTLISGGNVSYANSPAATGFGAILVVVGNTYSTDMNTTGQSAIVAANNAGTTGVVFTEWASYMSGTSYWATLKQLVLMSYSSSVSGTLTYTLTSAGHPLWTGLPTSFATVNSVYHATGSLKNGGVSIATVGSTNGVIVKDATGRVVELNDTAHGGGNTGTPWTNDTNFSKLTANALKWAARCM